MPKLTKKLPAYRLHRASGQAVVTLSRQDHYLGKHGTDASRRRYEKLLGQWLAAGRKPLRERRRARSSGQVPGDAAEDPDAITVVELLARYLRHAKVYYCKDGRPTSEYLAMRTVIRTLNHHCGRTPAARFGPRMLMAVREKLIDAGQCRKSVNGNVGRVRRIFRWAVKQQLIPASVWHALQAVEGFRRGRSRAPETEPIRPVAWRAVEKVRPHVAPQVWAMIELSWLTGMRPGEVVIMRARDIDTTGPVWLYRPGTHKNAWREQERIVDLGPQAQQIVKSFLKADVGAYLFSPADAEAWRYSGLHAARKTPLSYGNRPGTNRRRRPGRRPGARYNVDSYRRAIARACDAAFPAPAPLGRLAGEGRAAWRARLTPGQRAELRAWQVDHRWHPNQLRHACATRIRKEFGVEAARAMLGHRTAVVTELYAEMDRQKIRQIVLNAG